MKKCNYCGMDGLEWDKAHFEIKKKWRLINPETNIPHECASQPPKKKWKSIPCIICGKKVLYNINHPDYDPESPCSECLREKHPLEDK